MNTKRHFWGIVVLAVVLVLSGCGPGQIFGPTPTSTPTATPTPTPTLEPSPTPNPLQVALERANNLRDAGNYEEALEEYKLILQKYSDDNPGVAKIYESIIEIADNYFVQAHESKGSVDTCESYKKAYAAFEIVLKSPNKPDNLGQYQTDAAETNVSMIDCDYKYNISNDTYKNIIELLVMNLEYYDGAPDAQEILLSKIVSMFSRMSLGGHDDNPQAVIDTGHSLIESIGSYNLDGKMVADIISDRLVKSEVCSGIIPTLPIIGITEPKKILACTGVPLGKNDLISNNLNETWYALIYESAAESELHCTGRNLTTGKNFSYTYSGAIIETYSLLDVHTGKVLASKTFRGTSPKCVFTSCSLNTFTNTANCTGGGSHSTYDADEMLQWLETKLR